MFPSATTSIYQLSSTIKNTAFCRNKSQIWLFLYVRSGPFVYKNKSLLKNSLARKFTTRVFSPGVTFGLRHIKQSISEGVIFAMLAKNFGERHTLIFSYVLSQRLFLAISKTQVDWKWIRWSNLVKSRVNLNHKCTIISLVGWDLKKKN